MTDIVSDTVSDPCLDVGGTGRWYRPHLWAPFPSRLFLSPTRNKWQKNGWDVSMGVHCCCMTVPNTYSRNYLNPSITQNFHSTNCDVSGKEQFQNVSETRNPLWSELLLSTFLNYVPFARWQTTISQCPSFSPRHACNKYHQGEMDGQMEWMLDKETEFRIFHLFNKIENMLFKRGGKKPSMLSTETFLKQIEFLFLICKSNNNNKKVRFISEVIRAHGKTFQQQRGS